MDIHTRHNSADFAPPSRRKVAGSHEVCRLKYTLKSPDDR